MQQSNRPLGLYHSEADLQLARENLAREPIRGALARLEAPEADPLAEAYLSALRGQLFDNLEAGYRAAAALNQADLQLNDDRAGIKRALAWLSVAAMLRDHDAWEASWRDVIAGALDRFRETGEPLRDLWLGALAMAAGILLESDEAIQRGAAVYRRTVDQQIHPEGFLKGIADVDDAPGRYEAQVSGSCALVLLAEMAALIGLDLWSYDSRAVSVSTAVTYTHFYYFYPEKWRWETDLTRERDGCGHAPRRRLHGAGQSARSASGNRTLPRRTAPAILFLRRRLDDLDAWADAREEAALALLVRRSNKHSLRCNQIGRRPSVSPRQ